MIRRHDLDGVHVLLFFQKLAEVGVALAQVEAPQQLAVEGQAVRIVLTRQEATRPVAQKATSHRMLGITLDSDFA